MTDAPRGLVCGTFKGDSRSWSAAKRQWRTECDNAVTGRGGCRSYTQASIVAPVGGSYQWTEKWIFNSQVPVVPSASNTQWGCGHSRSVSAWAATYISKPGMVKATLP